MSTAPPPAHGAAGLPSPFLGLLGRFRLEAADRPIYLPPGGQRLLAYVALHQDGVGRGQAADLLWPRVPRARAAANLRSTLWRMSRNSGPHHMIDFDAERLYLADQVRVDLRAAARRAAALAGDPGSDAPGMRVPVALREDLLPHWDEYWLVDAREHFHQTRLHALESLSRHHRTEGRMYAALEYAMTAVDAEPLRESAHREITAVHLAEGNVAEAVRHYETYRRRLRGELGLPPSTEYRRLLAPYLARASP